MDLNGWILAKCVCGSCVWFLTGTFLLDKTSSVWLSFVVTMLTFPFNKIIVLSGAIRRQMLLFYLGICFQTMVIWCFPQLWVNNSDTKACDISENTEYAKSRNRVLHIQEKMCVCRAAGEPYCCFEMSGRENQIFNFHFAFDLIILFTLLVCTFFFSKSRHDKQQNIFYCSWVV